MKTTHAHQTCSKTLKYGEKRLEFLQVYGMAVIFLCFPIILLANN